MDVLLKNECKNKLESDLTNSEENISASEIADKTTLNMALIKHNESICLEVADDSLRTQCTQMLTNK